LAGAISSLTLDITFTLGQFTNLKSALSSGIDAYSLTDLYPKLEKKKKQETADRSIYSK